VFDLPDGKKGNLYSVYEVYLDNDGNPIDTSSFSIGPAAETVKELRSELRNILRALDSKPINLNDLLPKWEPIEVPDEESTTLEVID